MILSDGGFFRELSDNRICCVTGRLGSGKTLLGLDLAAYYLERGYSLVTNTSTVWADNPADVIIDAKRRARDASRERGITIAPQVKAVSLVDEGGLYARTAKTAENLASYARKTDQIIIFSGKKMPHPSLADLRVVMWFDFHKNFFLPFKLWEWSYRLSPKKIYYGKILQTNWRDLFGIYSTIDPASDARDIINFSLQATQLLFETYGRSPHRNSRQKTAEKKTHGLSGLEGKSDPTATDAMETLAASLADAMESSLTSVQARGGRRRK